MGMTQVGGRYAPARTMALCHVRYRGCEMSREDGASSRNPSGRSSSSCLNKVRNSSIHQGERMGGSDEPVLLIKFEDVVVAWLAASGGHVAKVTIDDGERVLEELAAHVGRFGRGRGSDEGGNGGEGGVVDVGGKGATHCAKTGK